jgi:uncharacterized membrane protein
MSTTEAEKSVSDKNLTTIIYALYAVSLIFGVTCLIAIIINYVKRDDVAGTWLESHFRWQMRTFWFSLLWGLIGLATSFIVIGFAVLFADLIWYIYRIVKGWIRLNDGKPMYAE